MITAEELQQNKNHICERIRQAALRAGRSPEEIRLMAVTKTLPPETIQLAIQQGLYVFGESRVQEATAKFGKLLESAAADASIPLELHMIGPLQSNKAKQAAQIFSWVQSIEKMSTACELNKWAARLDKPINILLEVNTSGEESKHGFHRETELFSCCQAIRELSHLRLRGLMTIGPFTTAEDKIRAAFKKLAGLFQEMKSMYPDLAIDTLSMGMSSDFELAIEEGSTLVRIGTTLFGERERV